MTDPGPPLFLAGNARDNQTGSRVGAVVAVVLLMLGSGAAGLFGLFFFPFTSDACGDSDTQFICTANGQQAVAVVPMWAAVIGTVVAACALALRPPYRAVVITLGYVVAFGGFLAAAIVVSQV
ncbi:hypothetical protein [Staphylococcus capitis]|uniref:hypothetical protein n=1 Tax=Staphylococcus capitis TaxID=29388 RepID=UPI003D04478E